MTHSVRHMALPLLAAMAALACSAAPTDGKLSVVTTIFPLYDWAVQVGGEHVEASLLLSPGTAAHGFSPRPGDIARIRHADVFLWTGPAMEPWAQGILSGAGATHCLAVDTSAGLTPACDADAHGEHEPPKGFIARILQAMPGRRLLHRHGDGCPHGSHPHGADPHIWLDPVLAQRMVRTIADAFASRDPANADFFRNRAEDYVRRLAEFDADARAMLAGRRVNTIVYGGHFAFGLFAQRYGLEHVTPYRGFAPNAAPTPRAVKELIDRLRELDSRVIFYEPGLDPKAARIIAEETGAKLLPLHPAHNLSADERAQGVTYLELMRHNLENLKEGLDCKP